MSSTDSVGQISLDLVLNSDQFREQLDNSVNGALRNLNKNVGGGLKSSFAGLGKVIAGAFAVKGIASFTKSCLDLGSDLAEVQNVVDVTFATMNESVNQFASTAIDKFGLSETVAKKYVGTFGAMAKAYGYTEAQAYEMSTALTGLTADVASFYNLSSDEAYTKMKSVFTGETESLKDLGIVMTQANLDQYALANGFGKTTKNMTEQEKVMLRYQFVMQQLSLANGDFARTADGWANQVRVLGLRFDQLKATLGQGFINLFTPIVKAINIVISKLQVLAEYFKSFTEWITGKKSDTGSIGSVAGEIADATGGVADATGNMRNATDKVGDSADKATESAKKLKRELMGFDKINRLSDNSNSNNSDTNKNPTAGGNGAGLDIGGLGAIVDEMDKQTNQVVSNLQNALSELVKSFKDGFLNGLGDNFEESFNAIKESARGIGTTLKAIFTDPQVVNASWVWANSVLYNLGTMAGSCVNIGMTVAQNVLGGIDQSLKENKEFIRDWIVSMFAINARVTAIQADFIKSCAEIFSVFRNNDAISITSDIVSMFTQGFANATLLSAKFGMDILDAITKPIRDNKDAMKTALENMLKPVSTVIGTLKDSFVQTWADIQKVYDEKVGPLIRSIGDGVSKIVGSIVDSYNKHMAPVLDKLATKLDEVYKDHIQPVLSKVISLFGSLADGIKDLWEKILVPCLDWIGKNIMPILAPVIELLGTTLLDTIGRIGDLVGGVIASLEGLVDFVVGVFTLNWEKAWLGVKKIFSNIWDSIKALLNLPEINVSVADIKKAIQEKWNEAKKWWDDSKQNLKEIVANIKAKVATKWSDIKNSWHGLVDNVKDKTANFKAHVANRWNDIKNTWNGMADNIKHKTADFRGRIANRWNDIKNSWYGMANNIKNKTASFYGKVATSANTIKKGWKSLSDQFKAKTVDFKVKLSTTVGNIKNFINDIIKAINDKVIAKLDFHIKAPAWLGGGSFGWKAPRIPMLAQGGYVKANTPQLAVIGDNRHQGEVVAPEDKLLEMALKAGRMASENSTSERLESLMETLISVVKSIDPNVYLDGNSIKNNVVNRINNTTRTTGRCPIIL